MSLSQKAATLAWSGPYVELSHIRPVSRTLREKRNRAACPLLPTSPVETGAVGIGHRRGDYRPQPSIVIARTTACHHRPPPLHDGGHLHLPAEHLTKSVVTPDLTQPDPVRLGGEICMLSSLMTSLMDQSAWSGVAESGLVQSARPSLAQPGPDPGLTEDSSTGSGRRPVRNSRDTDRVLVTQTGPVP